MHYCPAGVEENSVDSENDLLSIGEECEEWPVQKVKTQIFVQQFVTGFVCKFIYFYMRIMHIVLQCTVQRKVVKKVNPDTSCR